MLHLERMAESDAGVVAPLFLDDAQIQYWEGGKSHSIDSATSMLSRYFLLPSYHWILDWNSEVAGYGHVLRSDFLDAWIVSYIIHPNFQRRGLATSFVNQAKLFAEDETLGTLYASVHPRNLASLRVIEKSGFELVEEMTRSGDRLYRWPRTVS